MRFPALGRAPLCAALVCLAAVPARAADEKKPAGQPIDVVLCLDVSGSMNGLIDSAKMKLWDIVNDLGKVKPTPELRVGLYSYGHDSYDRNKGWIRKEVDLTHDLDTVYQKLNALTIRGGTEYVTRVCRDAVEEQKWSADKKALKIIFVCGNEPASQDKLVTLKEAADKAKAKGIVINSIFCGPADARDAADWKEFATLCGGRFASIDQNRNVLASIKTPFDEELAKLSGKLNTTYVVYGGAKGEAARQNQAAQDANAAKAAPGAAATRAASKASGLYRNDAWDLIDRMQRDKEFDVKKVPVDQLCDEMKKMTPQEREAYLKKKLEERQGLQRQIAELNQKREEFIRAELKKNPDPANKAFDEAVRGALREQAATKGIKIPD
jgi:hypothetical protein